VKHTIFQAFKHGVSDDRILRVVGNARCTVIRHVHDVHPLVVVGDAKLARSGLLTAVES
jgi:hypothetical protein